MVSTCRNIGNNNTFVFLSVLLVLLLSFRCIEIHSFTTTTTQQLPKNNPPKYNSFVDTTTTTTDRPTTHTVVKLHAVLPKRDSFTSRTDEDNSKKLMIQPQQLTAIRLLVSTTVLSLSLLLSFATPCIANAVSGGGLDYANIDISGQDFSNGNYKGKDFTQVIAKATKFSGSNLQGCRFYKAYLVRTDFSNADIRGASLEDTSMDDADLSGAIAVGAYFSASLKDVKSLTNSDFTDAQIPPKTLQTICARSDVQGTNPKTGVDTRESLMCL